MIKLEGKNVSLKLRVPLWLISCGVLLLCAGCLSVVEKAGQALDGSAFAEKKTAVYKTAKDNPVSLEIWEMLNKAGESSFLIMPGQFPSIKIRGSAPGSQGEFDLVSLDYLGGNTNGWNEYRLDLSGQGIIRLGETTATLSIPGKIAPIEISWGRIRRYDTRITGNDALTSLRNRRERLLAVAEWMNSPSDKGGQENVSPQNSRKDFEKYWKPILFPEMVSKKNRPEGWERENDQWVKAEDIRWNTGYTERVFPELLRDIRNSGTLLRDWEEAIEWLYIEYEWDRLTETLSQEIVLYKTGK
jgi:hypothetical protein